MKGLAAGLLLLGASFAQAQGSWNLAQTAQHTYPLGTCSDLWVEGDLLFVARRGEGFSVYDLADPAQPQHLYTGRPELFIQDVKAYGSLLYCSNESGNGRAVYVFDVSNPALPVEIGFFGSTILPSCNNLVVRGSHLYACSTTQNLVVVLDVTNPAAPVQVNSIASAYPISLIHDIAEVGGRLYISWLSGGFDVRDAAANPADPPLLASKQVPTSLVHNAWPLADPAYVATTDETSGGHLRVWHVLGPSQAAEVASWRASTVAVMHDLKIVDDVAFVTNYTEGVRVVSLADPANPVEIAYNDTYAGTTAFAFGAWGVFPFRRAVYVADFNRGLLSFSLAPASAALLATTPSVGWGDTLVLVLQGANQAPAPLPVLLDLTVSVAELGGGRASLLQGPLLLPAGFAGQGAWSLPLPAPGPPGPFHLDFRLSVGSPGGGLLYAEASTSVLLMD
jgi:hypothetical protein